jgi:pyruvate dehydrogenase E2 component (dihydrolipoamide acetyltransferase)
MNFLLPDLGEGIESGTVSRVHVKAGDAVTADQNVLTVETDKAAIDVPIDAAGTIESVLVKPGDKVAVGAPVFKLNGSAVQSAKAQPNPSKEPATNGTAPKADAAPAPVPSGGGTVEFKLPDLGEGIESGTVSRVHVKAGDAVTADQNVLTVETDKAAIDVPVDVAGTVESVAVKPGQKLAVGATVLTLKTAVGSAPPKQAKPDAPKAAPPKSQANGVAAPVPAGVKAASGPKTLVAAGPATRRLARELGVPLHDVPGTARAGRVTLDDLKGYVRTRIASPAGAPATHTGGSIVNVFTHPPLPDFSKFGEVEKKPTTVIRKKIAENLTVAWRMMPMVTQNELADITDLEAGRKRIVEGLPKGTAKVTWTVLAVKAVVAVLKEFPNFNSSLDMNAGELHVKKYYNVGIAVDTERGLVVPVIKNADTKTIREIATDVAQLAEKARTGKLSPDEMRGGTFTITNLGGIGGTSFTPIVNYPEVAILGLSKSTLQPVVKDGAIVPRLMMPLSLTYDHRVIDGADGCRFTARLAQLFSDPIRLLMES